MKKIIFGLLSYFGYVNHLYRFGSTMPRSPKWEQCKKEFEKTYPKECAVCGKSKVQLHHKQAFHAHPELELDPTNLVFLCEGLLTNNHHLWYGHLGNFQSINKDIDQWIDDVAHRPLWNGTNWINT